MQQKNVMEKLDIKFAEKKLLCIYKRQNELILRGVNMTYINITNDDSEEFNMVEDLEQLEIYPWIVLNLDEIGASIAYQLFDAEYNLHQEYLDEEINDYLSHIHERIFEKAVQKLEENGRVVI